MARAFLRVDDDATLASEDLERTEQTDSEREIGRWHLVTVPPRPRSP